jgi:plasmid stability protein
MKSITLHNLDREVAQELEKRARSHGHSLNRTAQDLLRVALGLQGSRGMDRTEIFRDLHGTWNEEDLNDFNERITDLQQVDLADWEG